MDTKAAPAMVEEVQVVASDELDETGNFEVLDPVGLEDRL
jgi:hypothetical protein